MDRRPLSALERLRNTRRSLGDGTLGGRSRLATPWVHQPVISGRRGIADALEGTTGVVCGRDAVPDGATSTAVEHGMAAPPASVVVTPHADERVWVPSRDAETFTVARAGTAGALGFDWQACGAAEEAPDPWVWYRADSIDAADGAEVTVWPDRMGVHDLVPGESSDGPTFVADAINGHPAITGPSANAVQADYVDHNLGPDVTVAVVLRWADTGRHSPLVSGHSVHASGIDTDFFDDWYEWFVGDAHWGREVPAVGPWVALLVRRNADTIEAWRNGTALPPDEWPSPPYDDVRQEWHLLRPFGAGSMLAEVIIWEAFLDGGDLDGVWDYLQDRYALW